jgi:hypothetical protein
MEYSGLIAKYRTNRPLTGQERADHLKQDLRLNVEPHYQLCVVKMNSTYLESVDKWYAWKGALSLFVIAIMIVLVGGLGWPALEVVLEAAGILPSPLVGISLASGIAMSIIVSCIALLTILVLRKESFAFTHYPIRFNRKTQLVHAFRTNGTVLSVPWDQVYFTLGHMPPWNETEVRGHVLDADNVTVRETFALSYVGMLGAMKAGPDRTPFATDDFVRAHWEFIRRYMEDGPQQLLGQVEYCMPVDGRRERFSLGAKRVFANIAGAPGGLFIMLLPWCAVVSLFRGFAMRTSKVPQWPEEIDAACAIEPDDPYAIAGDAQGQRVAVFPEAARMAGVAFIAPPGPAAGAERAGKGSDLTRGLKKK